MSSLRHNVVDFILVFLYFSQTLASNLGKDIDPDVLCSVTNHTDSDGLTSYEIKCQKMSTENKTIGCCAISNENGMASEWGARCGAGDDDLRHIINMKSNSDPTATTCALKIVFRAKEGNTIE